MKFYVVMTLIREGTDNLYRKIKIKNKETGLIGMLPVYSTKKQAMKEFPDKDILLFEGDIKE